MGDWPDWGKRYAPGLFVILPPDPIRSIVDAQRETYDPISQSYIGSHITVTQPFLKEPTKKDWDLCVQSLERIKPFVIQYGPLKSFLPYPCIWYDIQPAEIVLEIREALHQTGLFNLQEGYIEDFIPHMTITEGQSSPEVTSALLEELQKESHAGSFLCEELVLSAPDKDFRFTALNSISLKRPG
jgi:2'-5' RNA ligase